jgi:hypothetical protein
MCPEMTSSPWAKAIAEVSIRFISVAPVIELKARRCEDLVKFKINSLKISVFNNAIKT